MISRFKYYYNELIVLRRFYEIYQQCRCKHDRAYIYDRLIGSKGVRCGLWVSIFIHVCTCSDICKNQHSTSQLPQNISCFFLNKIVWIFWGMSNEINAYFFMLPLKCPFFILNL